MSEKLSPGLPLKSSIVTVLFGKKTNPPQGRSSGLLALPPEVGGNRLLIALLPSSTTGASITLWKHLLSKGCQHTESEDSYSPAGKPTAKTSSGEEEVRQASGGSYSCALGSSARCVGREDNSEDHGIHADQDGHARTFS